MSNKLFVRLAFAFFENSMKEVCLFETFGVVKCGFGSLADDIAFRAPNPQIGASFECSGAIRSSVSG